MTLKQSSVRQLAKWGGIRSVRTVHQHGYRSEVGTPLGRTDACRLLLVWTAQGKSSPRLYIDLQAVGDVIAVRPIAKDQAIRGMVMAKVFHEVPPVLAANSPTTASTHCRKRDSPHSKQRLLSREVINPQDGHIRCDPAPASWSFLLRVR
jgi:hypothetical protein